MSINFDKAIGIHEHSVKIRDARGEVLANNLANADTPGFKAKDLNFKDALEAFTSSKVQSGLKTTNNKHISNADIINDFSVEELDNVQASMDANTVDQQREIARFSENSMRYMASLRFLDSKFKGLIGAIRGE